jgi:hypothetical protein
MYVAPEGVILVARRFDVLFSEMPVPDTHDWGIGQKGRDEVGVNKRMHRQKAAAWCGHLSPNDQMNHDGS